MKKIIFLLIISIVLTGCNQESLSENKKIELPENKGINELILKLSDENYDIRINVSNKLTEIGEDAVPYIIASLKNDSYNATGSKSFNSRWNKVNVLGRIGNNEAEDVLIERILTDEETHVRWRSIWALNIVKNENTKNKLIKALKNENEKIKWRAAVALGSFKNDSGKEILLEGLNKEDSWFRWEAVYVLGILEDPSTAKEISKMLNDNSTRVRQEAALTLGKIGNKEVIPNLIKALDDESPGVRWRAASSLAKLGDKSIIPTIEKALEKEKDEDAYSYINKSLGKLKTG